MALVLEEVSSNLISATKYPVGSCFNNESQKLKYLSLCFYEPTQYCKDVCIMAFLGLHDLSRRIFQSAAI